MAKFGFGVEGHGYDDGSGLQVDAATGAARVALTPWDWDTRQVVGGGYYFIKGLAGISAAAFGSNGVFFSLSWLESRYVLVLLRASVIYLISVADATTTMQGAQLVRATGLIRADTGGTILTPAPCQRGRYGPSRASGVNVSTSAPLSTTGGADLTNIRVQVEGNPNVVKPTATLGVTPTELVLYSSQDAGAHPVILEQPEALRIRIDTALPTNQVLNAHVMLQWAEVPA